MKKAIVITLGVIIGVTGVLAICAHLADAARLALYVPEDEDDEDIYDMTAGTSPKRRLTEPTSLPRERVQHCSAFPRPAS